MGGETFNGKILDVIEVFKKNENIWQCVEVPISAPKKNLSVVSMNRDRLVIMGGWSKFGASRTCEEIDFIKNQSISLPAMKTERTRAYSFALNSNVYIFGGTPEVMKDAQEFGGEKFSYTGNKWQKINGDATPQVASKINLSDYIDGCPAALLFE